MPELILHFDASAEADADADAVALALQEHASALSGVTSAQAESLPKRGAPEIILALSVAANLLNSSATTLDALRKFLAALAPYGKALGLGKMRIEIGRKLIETDALTPEHAHEFENGG